MKREILFKAKRVDNKKWIEGYHRRNTFYNKLGDEPKEIYTKHFIGAFSNIELFDNLFEQIEVYPETVSQFIGLTDKNGIKIFEGDKTSNGYVVMWSKEKALFCEFFQLKLGNRWSEASYPIQDDRIEIIGNIHDNG